MQDPELLRRMSQKTRIQILVSEAQQGELSTSQIAELADQLAADPDDRAAIAQATIEQLVILKMPAGRLEDLRNAFAAARPGPVASAPPPAPAAAPPSAFPSTAAAARGYSTQRTKAVTPAFKVPFEQRTERPTAVRPAADKPPAPAPPATPASQPEPPGPEAAADTDPKSAGEWAQLQAELLQLSNLTSPPPQPAVPARRPTPIPASAPAPAPALPPRQPTVVRKAPLPLRGKAAQILNQGGAVASPLPRPPAPPPPKTSSAEPPMRRDTMHFGSHVSVAQPIEQETAKRPVVLVADDDARIRMVFRIKLEQKGFRPLEAPNGAEAWKIIEQGMIDAIVLDMKMPGLHGLEVLQRLVNTKQNIPVVVCTAYDRLDDEFVVATYPRLRYLTKPVDADHLVETLTNLLAEQA